MEDPDRTVNPDQLEDPDQAAALSDAVRVEPVESVAAIEPTEPVEAEAPAPPLRRRPKVPTAVTVVVVIGVIAALIYLSRGAMSAWVLWRCNAMVRLADGMPAAFLQHMVCGPESTVIDPRELLANAIVGIGVAILMAIILVNFVRLRSWTWTALMLWGGFVLARDLFQYFVFPQERPNLYLGMLFSALIVLALNQEDVQTTFGIKRETHDILPAPSDTSILNVLPATVVALGEDSPGQTMVVLDAGSTRLLARVTQRSAQALALASGQPVFAQIKGIAIVN